MNRKTLIAIALLAAPMISNAADAAPAYTGEASLGFLNASGNTDSRNLNGKVTVGYRDGAWGHTGTVGAYNGSTAGATSSERYQAGYKATYDFSPTDYAFGTLGYENDRFAGITQRTTEAVGYGRRLLTLPKHTLDAEIGAGLTQVTPRGGSSTNSAVGLLNARYKWLISDTTTFSQTLKVEQSKDNTYLNPISELKTIVAGNLFTTLGYEIRYNSDVPAGFHHTDTLTSVNLGYNFGAKK